MAMAWAAVAARAGRSFRARPAIKPPCRTARRVSAPLAKAHRSNGGVGWVRMRFAPILREFTTQHAAAPGSDFLMLSWLYCRREFGYQAARGRHAAAVFHAERADQRATGRPGVLPPTGQQGTSCNEQSDRTGTAAGPGAERHIGRLW